MYIQFYIVVITLCKKWLKDDADDAAADDDDDDDDDVRILTFYIIYDINDVSRDWMSSGICITHIVLGIFNCKDTHIYC